MTYKIKNAVVITNNENDDVLNNAEIYIKDGKISYVGEPSDKKDSEFDRVIDAEFNIVSPGFFNTHTHIPMTLFRGYADDLALQDWLFNKIFPAEDKLTPDMVYWASLAALTEMAAGGTVCINDQYSFCDSMMKAINLAGFKAAIGRGVVSFDEKGTRIRIEEACNLYKKHHKPGKIHVFISPHAQYTVNNKTLKELADLAKEYHIGVHTHISETKNEHEECIAEHGKTPIALMEEAGLLDVPFIGAHCVWADDNDLEILKKHNSSVASCPRSNLKLASGIAPLKKMIDKGINVTLGTDGAASNNRLSMLSEISTAALVQKGVTGDPTALPAFQAFKLGTLNGAKALGFNSGSIEIGKDADLIIFNDKSIRYTPHYNPLSALVYAANDISVILTMIDGNIVYENGEITFADEQEIKERLEYYAKEIAR